MIAVITDPEVGGTFLTWTIYYLSGKTQYFSQTEQAFVELPSNPLTSKNAHKFGATHPNNIDDFNRYLPAAITNDECIYMHQFRSNTKLAIDQLCTSTVKIVVVATPKTQALYHCKYQHRSDVVPAWTSPLMLNDPDEIYQDVISYFFADSKLAWENENLNDIWDKREFIALNFDFTSWDDIISYIDPAIKYYRIDTMDLWTSFDSSVRDMFEYLDINIDESRYAQWTLVYNQWKTVHTDRVKFIWYFDIIVNAILDNTDIDLARFNLDICQEAAIQHELIYKHNLNLKTWQLDKFLNTMQLHNLLEPNIHDLSKSRLTGNKRLTT